MEKVFECKYCNYHTTRCSDYKRHIKTNKHIKNKNENKYTINYDIIRDKFTCAHCKNVFSGSSVLSRHMKTCKFKMIELDKLKGELEKASSKLKYKDQIIESKDQIIESKDQMIESKDRIISELLKGTTTINLVNSAFNKAKPLVPLKSYRQIKSYQQSETSNKDFLETMAYHYENLTIHEFLGDFVIENYQNPTKPHLQSMWSTDVSRLNYVVRKLIGEKRCWTVDKRGIITKETVIDPLLDYINKYLDSVSVKEITKKYNTLDAVNMINMITFTCDEIDKGFMAQKIIKYITPHFHIKKKLLLKYIVR